MAEKMLCLITPGGEIVIEPKETDLQTLHSLVGGYLEVVRIPSMPNAHAYVDEEGLFKRLLVNRIASRLAQTTIVGPMVILGNTPNGGEGDCPDSIYRVLKSVGVE